MIKKNYKDVHFINKGTQVIDKIYKDNQLVFEQGYTREQEEVPPLTTTYKALGKDLKDYKIYGNTRLRVLPEEYQEVEYLENHWYEYIDTGVTASANFKFHIKYKDVVGEDSNYVTGARATSGGSIFAGISGSSATGVINVTRTNLTTPNNYRQPNVSYDVTAEYNSEGTGTATLKNLNTNETLTGVQNAQIESTVSQKIFAVRTGQIHKGMALYEYQCWNDGVLVRNFVPCYRKSDNVAGLYDMVEGVFYTKTGSGDFTVGPDVASSAPTTLAPVEVESVGDYISPSGVPAEYQEVEYLESTGTQYIDTGIAGNITAILDVQGTRTDDNDSNVVIGCNSPVSNWFGRYTTYNRWALATEVGTYFDIPYTDRVTVTLNFTSNSATAIIDGVEKTRVGQTTTRDSNYWLMACNRLTAGSNFYAYCKIYSCRMVKDGALVRNFIPCVRKIDNKVGMYDLVTDTFFANQGTGEFIAGPTVKRYVIPVKIAGKNFIPYPYVTADGVYSNVTFSTSSDGRIIASGTSTNSFAFVLTSNLILKSGEYTVSVSGEKSNVQIRVRNGSTNIATVSGTSSRFTLTEDTTVTVDVVRLGADISMQSVGIMIESGSTATEYEPYVEPTTEYIYLDEPLRKSGEVADYIDFKNQKVVRNLTEVDMGELRYTNNGTDSVWGALTTRKSGSQNGLTSKFRQVAGSVAASAMPNNTFKFYTTSTSVAVKMTGISASNAVEMLSGTRLVYELATPIEEVVTLPSIPTVKGTTIYEVDTKVQPSNMYIKYKSR